VYIFVCCLIALLSVEQRHMYWSCRQNCFVDERDVPLKCINVWRHCTCIRIQSTECVLRVFQLFFFFFFKWNLTFSGWFSQSCWCRVRSLLGRYIVWCRWQVPVLEATGSCHMITCRWRLLSLYNISTCLSYTDCHIPEASRLHIVPYSVPAHVLFVCYRFA
jgi:hypothetical protein